jgi:hypothetical protein
VHLTVVGARTFLSFLSPRMCAHPTADRNVRAPPDMFASFDKGELRPDRKDSQKVGCAAAGNPITNGVRMALSRYGRSG